MFFKTTVANFDVIFVEDLIKFGQGLNGLWINFFLISVVSLDFFVERRIKPYNIVFTMFWFLGVFIDIC